MAAYPSKVRDKARKLFEGGLTDAAEIARLVGVKKASTIKKWRLSEGWKEKKQTDRGDVEEYLAIIDEAIGVLKEKISGGTIKGTFSDLEKLIRLRSFLLNNIEEKSEVSSSLIKEDISDDELDQEIKATEARIAALEGKKSKKKIGGKRN